MRVRVRGLGRDKPEGGQMDPVQEIVYVWVGVQDEGYTRNKDRGRGGGGGGGEDKYKN